MRRLMIAAAAFILLVTLVLLAAPLFIDLDRFRPEIQSELETKLKRKVKIGSIRLRVMPLGARVTDVEIAESRTVPSDRPFATAKELYATVAPLSILRGHPELKSIRLGQPQIQLIRDASGTWNFSSLAN